LRDKNLNMRDKNLAKFLIILVIVNLIVISSLIVTVFSYGGYDNVYRPLIGGVQIETQRNYQFGFCSLGVYIKYGNNDDGFLTAGHCVDLWTSVYQPARYYFIGIVSREPPAFPDGQKLFDAAIIQLAVSAGPFIYEYPTIDMNQKVGVLRIYNNGELIKYQTILYKSGSATGLTSGRYVDKYNSCRPGEYACQPVIVIKGMQGYKGDSGAPVYIRILESPPTSPDRVNYVAIFVGLLSRVGYTSSDGWVAEATDIYQILTYWPDVRVVSCTTYPTCK